MDFVENLFFIYFEIVEFYPINFNLVYLDFWLLDLYSTFHFFGTLT